MISNVIVQYSSGFKIIKFRMSCEKSLTLFFYSRNSFKVIEQLKFQARERFIRGKGYETNADKRHFKVKNIYVHILNRTEEII